MASTILARFQNSLTTTSQKAEKWTQPYRWANPNRSPIQPEGGTGKQTDWTGSPRGD